MTGITVKDGTVRGVETDGGISPPKSSSLRRPVGAKVGLMCGVTVPLHSAEHMYIVTGRSRGASRLPVLARPGRLQSISRRKSRVSSCGFEPEAKPWGMNGIPDDFEFALLADDGTQFEI